MKQESYESDSLLTSYQVGTLLQVNPSSVNKWVKDGHISAFRTPGGHHRIRAADLVSFLNTHGMPVPNPLVNAGKRRLLIADTGLEAAVSIKRELQPFNDALEIRVANDLVDALIQVGSFKPHAIILGENVDSVSAFDLCQKLKGNEETDNIKVFVMVESIEPEHEGRAEGSGVNALLSYPIEANLVMDEIKRSA